MERIILSGVPASPYTRKMLALLRFRRIPYTLIIGRGEIAGLPTPKVTLLPTFYLRNQGGELKAVTDSTPILLRLEAEHPGRSARPENPVMAFLDSLIEDYGDEWLTKAMFHYRWAYAEDAEKSARVLPSYRSRLGSDAELAQSGDDFRSRQVERLRYVGSNAVTGPVIEASYVGFLRAFEPHLREHPFLLGRRPGAGDFGVFGQLSQLAQFDPTPMAIAAREAPRVCAWTGLADDLSGLEPQEADWFKPEDLPASLKSLLVETGRFYPSLLLANAAALQRGDSWLETEIGGHPWRQQPFTYQGKCLSWLRAEYRRLDADARALADAALEGTGWSALFDGR